MKYNLKDMKYFDPVTGVIVYDVNRMEVLYIVNAFQDISDREAKIFCFQLRFCNETKKYFKYTYIGYEAINPINHHVEEFIEVLTEKEASRFLLSTVSDIPNCITNESIKNDSFRIMFAKKHPNHVKLVEFES